MMWHRLAIRPLRGAALLLGAIALVLAAVQPAAADRGHGGGFHGGGFHGGGFHGGGFHRDGFRHDGFHRDGFRHDRDFGRFRRFHSFAFFGAGPGFGYYGYYPYAYPYYAPYYPAYYPPPTYVSPTACYQPPVPRAPGVADLYTCSGQYVGPIEVP
jgi:hypothetical protein